MKTTARARSGGGGSRAARGIAGAALPFLLGVACVAHAAPCEKPADDATVRAALADIEASVDPCGESGQVAEMLRRFRRCAESGTTIRINHGAERNIIECDGAVTTITWNPGLRTAIERGCGGDPARPVLRDPTASLLHELVHAVQVCDGLEPGRHELEAVRIENIYRRGRALCQRTRYGDEILPASMLVACEPGGCGCGAVRAAVENASAPDAAAAPARSTAGDGADAAAAR